MSFLKSVFATFIGLLLFFTFSFGLFMIIAIAASGEDTPVVEENSVLYIPMTGQLVEQVVESPLEGIFGDTPDQLGLREVIKSIEYAQEDDRIAGIYIETKYLQASFKRQQH